MFADPDTSGHALLHLNVKTSISHHTFVVSRCFVRFTVNFESNHWSIGAIWGWEPGSRHTLFNV